MITTTVTCDRCEQVIPTSDQVWSVGVSMACRQSNGYPLSTNPDLRGKYSDWCRSCVEQQNLLCQVRAPGSSLPDPTPAEKLEEIIRVLIQETIDASAT